MRLRPHAADAERSADHAVPGAAAGAGADPGSLYGSWAATRWQYTSQADSGQRSDVICDRGGSVTLSLSGDTWVLTSAVPGAGGWQVGGSLTVDGDRLVLLPHGADTSEPVVFRLAGDTLALSSDASAWDFDGSGAEEAAEFVAVLVRL